MSNDSQQIVSKAWNFAHVLHPLKRSDLDEFVEG